MKHYYERNDHLLNHKVNKKFEEVLRMTKDEFYDWCVALRATVVHIWDELNTPPVVGKSEKDMIAIMNDMIGFPTHEFKVKDELTGEVDVIRNTQTEYSGVVNGFFPTMKTRIN
jgi:RNA-splicing ligase RtcB